MRTLKVLLIQPSSRDSVKTRPLFSIYNTDEGIGFKPPIGLLSIATAIKEKTSHHVDILDCQLDDVHQGNILEFVKEKYDVIGIAAWTDYWYQALGMAKVLKAGFPGAHLAMGGPHVSIFPKEVLSFECVDSIIMGDGEIPVVKLLEYLASDEATQGAGREIPGVYFKGGRYIEYTPFVCQDLDSLPIPDRSLLPVERYYSVVSNKKFSTIMLTSRGCPHTCTFCKLHHQQPVSRSAQSVVREFEMIRSLGIREVEVFDDTFNWSHQRTKEICQGIIDKKLDVRWTIRDRVDRVREDVLIELRKAGCYRIQLGVESANEKTLKAIKKNITAEQVRGAVALAKKHNFTVLTYFMYGLPGETLGEARRTLEFAFELDTDYASFTITIPYPGTEIYRDALRSGVIPVDYWLDFARNPVASFEIPYLIEDRISRRELFALRDFSVKKFYFRPRYMLREVIKIKHFAELSRKINMALGLFNLTRGKYR